MSNERRDNPYASPESTQCKANPVERSSVSPRPIVSFTIVFGLFLGAVSSYVRPMISGPIHFEAIASLFLIILFLVIAMFFCIRTAGPLRWMSVVVVLTWVSYYVSWSLVAQRVWDDMLWLMLAGVAVSLTVALPIVFLWRRMRDRKQ